MRIEPASVAGHRWEAGAAAQGRQRLTASFWDGSSEWIADRRERRQLG
jgi:hypothetical protein